MRRPFSSGTLSLQDDSSTSKEPPPAGCSVSFNSPAEAPIAAPTNKQSSRMSVAFDYQSLPRIYQDPEQRRSDIQSTHDQQRRLPVGELDHYPGGHDRTEDRA